MGLGFGNILCVCWHHDIARFDMRNAKLFDIEDFQKGRIRKSASRVLRSTKLKLPTFDAFYCDHHFEVMQLSLLPLLPQFSVSAWANNFTTWITQLIATLRYMAYLVILKLFLQYRTSKFFFQYCWTLKSKFRSCFKKIYYNMHFPWIWFEVN